MSTSKSLTAASGATIKDVAKHANVSIKTVSRVLNEDDNVRDKTIAKVKAAITALDYKPNLHARKLRKQMSYMLAVLHCHPEEPIASRLVQGVYNGCNKVGFDMLLHPCEPDSDNLVNEIVEMVQRTQVDGLVVGPPLSNNSELTSTLHKLNIPFVSLAPKLPYPYPYVASQERAVAKQVTEYLISLGHKAIALIIGPSGHGAAEWRLEGYQDAMKEAGYELPEAMIIEAKGDFTSGEKAARKLLNSDVRPTAIFATTDSMACGVYKVAAQLNIKIPSQLSVIGFDDVQLAQQLWPALTTVRQPTAELCDNAVRMLVSMVNEKRWDVENTTDLDCQLIVRDSTAPCT
ncbi:LacI family DNA-binding transcriptional regulator [Thalassotalea montiporae]